MLQKFLLKQVVLLWDELRRYAWPLIKNWALDPEKAKAARERDRQRWERYAAKAQGTPDDYDDRLAQMIALRCKFRTQSGKESLERRVYKRVAEIESILNKTSELTQEQHAEVKALAEAAGTILRADPLQAAFLKAGTRKEET